MTDEEKDREVVVSRTIEAPRDLVFEAFSEVRHLSKWFGPTGFSTTTHAFEFRPGGVWDYTMHGPDGTDYPNHVEYLEISPPERIVMRHGSRRDDPDAFVSTVTFDEQVGDCEVTLRSVFKTKELRDRAVERFHAIEGAEQTLSRLAAHVERNRGKS
ncbi:MAG: SRPBCC family protein [Acidimicrobiia bacterium]